MKKFFPVIILVALLCCACGEGSSKTVDTAALASSLLNDISYEEQLTELDKEDISNYIDLEDGTEAVMYMSSGSTAEEIAVFTAKDKGSAAKQKENVQSFLNDQKDSFSAYIPQEAKRIEDAVLVTDGNYVILCVSGESEKAQVIIDQALK